MLPFSSTSCSYVHSPFFAALVWTRDFADPMPPVLGNSSAPGSVSSDGDDLPQLSKTPSLPLPVFQTGRSPKAQELIDCLGVARRPTFVAVAS
jgi:hypothetical protein